MLHARSAQFHGSLGTLARVLICRTLENKSEYHHLIEFWFWEAWCEGGIVGPRTRRITSGA
eukprot:1022926-Amphidinium_carterae.1